MSRDGIIIWHRTAKGGGRRGEGRARRKIQHRRAQRRPQRRRTLLPRLHFWVHASRRVPAPRLVDVLLEFVETSHDDLVARYMHHVPQSHAHTPSDLDCATRDAFKLPHGPVA